MLDYTSIVLFRFNLYLNIYFLLEMFQISVTAAIVNSIVAFI